MGENRIQTMHKTNFKVLTKTANFMNTPLDMGASQKNLFAHTPALSVKTAAE